MNDPREHSSEQVSDNPVAALEARLGCKIADEALALAALTHKSYVNEHRGVRLTDNERLEFLGDAVIDLAVSHRLMERFPEAREGDLSKLRASLVDEAALTRLARALDLGSLLRLGRGEEMTGGREKSSLLADALEAVAAVLYLCGGLTAVLRLLDPFLAESFERAAAGTLDRDYKTQLQELAQSRTKATPRYRVVAERGPDHEKTFEVELELRGEVLGRGEGRSKKDAEQAAAQRGLEAMAGRFVNDGQRAGAPAVTPPLDELAVVAAGQGAPEPSAAPASPEAAPAPTPDTANEALLAAGEACSGPLPALPGAAAQDEAAPRKPAPRRRRPARAVKEARAPRRRAAAQAPPPAKKRAAAATAPKPPARPRKARATNPRAKKRR